MRQQQLCVGASIAFGLFSRLWSRGVVRGQPAGSSHSSSLRTAACTSYRDRLIPSFPPSAAAAPRVGTRSAMHLLAVVALLLLGEASAYTVRCARPVARSTRRVKTITAQATADDDEEEPMAIRAPMRMLGPYPVLSLRFPGIATPAQFKEQQKLTGETGVALDFVVDTAANVNTINAKLTAMSKATWSARADHAADWPRLAEAWGSLGHVLALREAFGELACFAT